MDTGIVFLVLIVGAFLIFGTWYWKWYTKNSMPPEIAELIRESKETAEPIASNFKSESEKIRSEFNLLIWSFLVIVLFQGLGFSSSIGRVLQELFGISRVTSLLVVWLLSLPIFVLLKGMQLMTQAILLNKK